MTLTILIPCLVVSVTLNIYQQYSRKKDIRFLFKTAWNIEHDNVITRNKRKRLNVAYNYIKSMALENRRFKHGSKQAGSKLDEIEAILAKPKFDRPCNRTTCQITDLSMCRLCVHNKRTAIN